MALFVKSVVRFQVHGPEQRHHTDKTRRDQKTKGAPDSSPAASGEVCYFSLDFELNLLLTNCRNVSALFVLKCSLLSCRYLSYGSGPKRFPLADVLQYAMEFASSKPVCTSPVEDIDTTAPPGGTTAQVPPAARQEPAVFNILVWKDVTCILALFVLIKWIW